MTRINPFRFTSMFALVSATLALPIHAAVVTDPTLFTGANAIDPTGGQDAEFTVSGSTAQATLEGRGDFFAIHDFAGFSAASNIISFTDPSRPDIQLSFSGSFDAANAGLELADPINHTQHSTSPFSAMQLRNSGANTTSTLTIDFGSWNGSSFDGSVNSVAAAGFTLNNSYLGLTYTINFLANDNTVLLTGSFPGSDSPEARDAYSGFQSSTHNIGKITIARAVGSGSFSSGFDDLGFTTTIPEPQTGLMLLMGVGTQFLLRRRRRC
jgi:hypothetical protein